jgi:pimeloyl-ACP methyl ester carboxylesterase
MPESNTPVIVIVPGSFSSASLYYPLVNLLQKQGYEATVGELPSASRNPTEQAATVDDDAAYFQAIIEKFADQSKDVVIVTHSYGGIPGTQSAKGLLKKERCEDGKTGGVIKIVYLTSVVPEEGQSLQDAMGDLVPDYIKVEVSRNGQLMTSTELQG